MTATLTDAPEPDDQAEAEPQPLIRLPAAVRAFLTSRPVLIAMGAAGMWAAIKELVRNYEYIQAGLHPPAPPAPCAGCAQAGDGATLTIEGPAGRLVHGSLDELADAARLSGGRATLIGPDFPLLDAPELVVRIDTEPTDGEAVDG